MGVADCIRIKTVETYESQFLKQSEIKTVPCFVMVCEIDKELTPEQNEDYTFKVAQKMRDVFEGLTIEVE